MTEKSDYKIQHKLEKKQGKISMYKSLVFGDGSFFAFIYFEIITMFLGSFPGALGIFLRSIFYKPLFKKFGRGVLIGRNIVIRHPKSIELGDGIVIDDNALLDAKGKGNIIRIGDYSYIGRNTILSCKNGNIFLDEYVNIGHNCILFSSFDLKVGGGTMIAAFCHLLSGGEYDYKINIPFYKQAGIKPGKPTIIGRNSWLGSNVTVISEKAIGEHCIIGAKSLVSKDIESDSIAFGTRIKVHKKLDPLKEEYQEDIH